MNDSSIRQILKYLPNSVRGALETIPPAQLGRLEELRFRMGCEITMVIGGEPEQPLSLEKPLICTEQVLQFLVNASTGYSAYAAEDALRQGFLPLEGGHRLGVCGTAVLRDNQIATQKAISSANLRIARQWFGCADNAVAEIMAFPGSTLLLGPPNSGKTTLLRDIVRQLSDKFGQRMGVVDSRGEIAACFDGMPQLQVGKRTDVISLAPKTQGMEILVRTMNPQWIAVDEITAAADVDAMVRASYCGVYLLATAHAFCRRDLEVRPVYQTMMKLGCFQNLITLNREKKIHMERVEA